MVFISRLFPVLCTSVFTLIDGISLCFVKKNAHCWMLIILPAIPLRFCPLKKIYEITLN